MIKTAEARNVYESPNSNSRIVAHLAAGSEVEIMRANVDVAKRRWVEVKTKDRKIGYIIEIAPAVPMIEEPTVVPPSATRKGIGSILRYLALFMLLPAVPAIIGKSTRSFEEVMPWSLLVAAGAVGMFGLFLMEPTRIYANRKPPKALLRRSSFYVCLALLLIGTPLIAALASTSVRDCYEQVESSMLLNCVSCLSRGHNFLNVDEGACLLKPTSQADGRGRIFAQCPPILFARSSDPAAPNACWVFK